MPDDERNKTAIRRRRPRGAGCVYQKHCHGCERPVDAAGKSRCRCVWWIAYHGPDARRHAESTESHRKGDAERLLQRRVGARENNLPVMPRAERITFDEAARAVKDDFKINRKPSEAVLVRRIDKHLTPFFGGRRLVGITAADISAYVARRQEQGIVAWKGRRKGQRIGDVSNTEINHELKTLKRIFNLAVEQDQLPRAPVKIRLLNEPPPRSGFFEDEQIRSVLAHLPRELRPVVEFGWITGWRLASEVLPLEWRHVDFKAGEVRLDPGTTKNGDGRTFPMTVRLRQLLEERQAEHERAKKAGHITPHVFFRMVATRRGGAKEPTPIVSFKRAWWLVSCG